jgi:DNA-binding transcriptional LysR family regulator
MSHIGELAEMRAFVRSIELGNFSAAARELKLTPSTLSKLVTRLERAFGVALVKRSTREVVATPEGDLFAARCRRILAEMEDAETEVSRSRERPRGKLRIHVGPGFGMLQLLPAMPRFLERFPEVEIDVVLEDRRIDLLRENFDLSITVLGPDHDNVVARKLFEFERIAAAAPSYVKRHGLPQSPEEILARHRCIRVASTLSVPWQVQMPSGLRTLDPRPYVVANNAAFATQLVFDGAGISQMMEFQVLEGLRDGRLVAVLPQYPCPDKRVMAALYPHERNRLPRVKAMLDFLEETFTPRPWRREGRVSRRGSSRARRR